MKLILQSSLAICIVALSLISCGGTTNDNNAYQYACPMKCEGDQVHDEPGQCSVCHMDMTEVK